MEVTWQRHEIKNLDQELNVKHHLQLSTNGLDTNAQNLHKDFIKNLPHLSEVRNEHMGIMADISSKIEDSFIPDTIISISDCSIPVSYTHLTLPTKRIV